MANLLDYLDWRGDLSFSAAPFCEVDNLILSLLSYPDYSTLLLEQDRVGLPLEKLVPLYFTHRPRGAGGLGLLLGERILDLLERAAASPRFANVRVWGHRSRLDKGRDCNFPPPPSLWEAVRASWPSGAATTPSPAGRRIST